MSETCESCVFWNRDWKRRATESPEHGDWRPCTNTFPYLRRRGGVEMPTRGNLILTAPGATCNGHAPVRRVEA